MALPFDFRKPSISDFQVTATRSSSHRNLITNRELIPERNPTMNSTSEPIHKQNSFQNLPTELILTISTFITYGDAIKLSQTSQRFFQIIVPQTWPVSGKEAFLEVAEKWPRYRIPGPPADRAVQYTILGSKCRVCFTIKPISAFSRKQVQKSRMEGYPPKICMSCAIATGLYQSGMILFIDFQRTVVNEGYYQTRAALEKVGLPIHLRLVCASCHDAQEFEYSTRQALCLHCSHTPRDPRELPESERRSRPAWRPVRRDWEPVSAKFDLVGPTCKACSTVHPFDERFHGLCC